MDSKLLMHFAYRGLVEEIAEIEQRLAVKNNTLPLQRIWRQLGTRHDVWANRAEWVEKERQSDQGRRDMLLRNLVELEAHYKKYHDADEEAWANAAADFIRQGRRKP